MEEEKIRMRLSIVQSEGLKAIITLKSKKIPAFIASVGEFNFKGEDNLITLLRNESTINFPVEGKEFVTKIKNIASVVKYEE